METGSNAIQSRERPNAQDWKFKKKKVLKCFYVPYKNILLFI